MAGVTLDNVTKRFDEVVAVDKSNLEIRDKEFLNDLKRRNSIRDTNTISDILDGYIYKVN